ncbi:MAG: HD family phosphohydrolase [Bacteroidia bacterium]
MQDLLAYLRNKHGLWFKLGVFLCTLFFIVWLLPSPNAITLSYQLNKPWDKEDLIAPFDFAVYKSDTEISQEKQAIKQHAELYYLYNDSVFKNNRKLFFLKNKLNKQEEAICAEIFDALLAKNIIELPDTTLPENNGEIEIEKNKTLESARLHDFYTLTQADSFLTSTIKKQFNTKTSLRLIEGMENSLAHTLAFNKRITTQNIQQQLNNVVSIKDKNVKGQSIIKRGDVVNTNNVAVLQSMQKEINKQDYRNQNSIISLLGKVIYVGLCLLMVFLFLGLFRTGIFSRNTHISFIFLVIGAFVLTCALADKNPLFSIYAIPFAIAPVLIRTFFDTRTALFVHLNIILLCALFAAEQKFNFLFIELLSGIGTIFSLANLVRRSQLLITAVVTYLISIFSFFSLNASIYDSLSLSATYPFLISSAGLLLAYPLIYVFEKLFGFVSDFTLLELNDIGSNPLLKQLATDAPGTFQHSLQVANMAEEAIRLVGGKPLLVRTGAMYHDVGKLQNPYFFIENQFSKINPHEGLSYQESAKIIIRHVIQGIEMAHKNRLPEQIIEFIRTHHGTTLASYFYYKSAEGNPNAKTDENKFRYPGPIPFSKETAVLMLADSVEASYRSLKTHDAVGIDDLVERIFKYKMDENQLINSDLTLRDLTLLKKTFKKRLMNMYHVRIEYPKQ